ncbi:MAG: hypothetical protein J5647_14240 [Spirochaetaceae bacterium]|nr:hypothetical protein [Spirochaetaceae bacterium]
MKLNKIARKSLEIAHKRHKNGEVNDVTTINMFKHCAGEVIEATEAYITYDNFEEPAGKKALALELADIIICTLIIAAKEDIDIEKSVLDAVEKNRKRAEKFLPKGIAKPSFKE